MLNACVISAVPTCDDDVEDCGNNTVCIDTFTQQGPHCECQTGYESTQDPIKECTGGGMRAVAARKYWGLHIKSPLTRSASLEYSHNDNCVGTGDTVGCRKNITDNQAPRQRSSSREHPLPSVTSNRHTGNSWFH